MNGRRYGMIRLAVVLAALLLALIPTTVAFGQESAPLKIRVETVDDGFRCTSTGPGAPACQDAKFGDYVITVPQGQMVELTFVWNHQGYPQEEHIIVLGGYKLEWDRLNSMNRESTVKFIADKPGTFEFKCELECDLHDYIHASLVVKRGGGGGGGATLTPTSLSVVPSSFVTGGDPVTFLATLRDKDGRPVPKAEIGFYMDAEFAGTKGPMFVGVQKTDANGVAFQEFTPTMAQSKYVITARFDGLGVYDESKQMFEIQQIGAPPPAYTTAPIGLESIRSWAPRGLILAIVAVWSVLAFVVFQAVGVAWARAKH